MSDDPKSKISALRVPEFKSTIPEHFVSKLSDQERYLVQTLSKMEQENAWMIVTLVESNTQIIDQDVRLQKVELWKDRLTSKWALVFGGLAVLVPVLLKSLFDHFLKHP